MAINSANQYIYTGKGPLDAKSLVKTYAALTSEATWQIKKANGSTASVAYNGMIVAVWLDKDTSGKLTDKNGIYFLYDPTVTGSLGIPKVYIESNWHRLCTAAELKDVINTLSTVELELTGVKSRLATLEKDKVVIRRDNEYNYKNIKTPIENNEVCLVDVPGLGLRVKIGDGEKLFTELPYLDEAVLKNIDNLVIKGYFYQGVFYTDNTYSETLSAVSGRIYIDTLSSKLYTYNNSSNKYESYQTSLPNASATVAGVVKLYDQTGENIDGTMTQRAITSELDTINDELDDKFEMKVHRDAELLEFALDFETNRY